MAEEYSEEVDEHIIQEEYKVWKKNAPFLYDVVITHALDWPSLTCQWLPLREEVGSGDYANHKLVLGTHTNGGEDNHLMIANVKLPTDEVELDARKYDEERGELGGYGGSSAKIEVTITINHEREVNRARYCPQNYFLIATKSPSADVLIFDWSKHPSKPTDSVVRPNLRLKGHEKEGYGLAWSPFEPGKLISAGDDKLVCMWDINSGPATSSSSGFSIPANGTTLQANHKYAGHSDVVEDVAWHRHHKDLFASCGDDKLVCIWDFREAPGNPKQKFTAHDGDVMALSFNPFQENLLLTAGTDKAVKLWDQRSLKEAVHSFVQHNEEVFGVAWSPFSESVFASSSGDRRIFVWDCSKIGAPQDEEDAEDGPPELMFVHGGHTAKISDFGWCETEDWFIASVAEDNILQVWQMAENIYNEEDEQAGESSNKNGASKKVKDSELE